MRIEFDPTNPDEAAAVRAMLTAMQPRVAGGPIPPGQNIGAPDRGPELFVPNNEKITVPRLDMATGQWGTSEVSTDTPTVAEINDQIIKEYPDPSLDSNGEPWDARIHSTPPKLNADGTWRAKRGVKAEEIAAVRAERNLTATDAELIEQAEPLEIAPAQAPTPPSGQSEAPLASDASTVTEAEKSTEQTVSGSAPVPPVLPSATTTTEAASTHGSEAPTSPSFLDVMKAITAAQKDGKIDTAKVKELCAAVGAGESTMGLNGPDNGDKRGAFMALLGEVVS